MRRLTNLLALSVLLHLASSAFVRQDLVANRAGLPAQNTSTVQASNFDSNLSNPWGIAFGPTTPAWIADNGASRLSLISGAGSVNSLSVSVGTDHPTGLVFNPYSTDFLIPSNSSSASNSSSLFITATEEGNIWAWGASLGTQATLVASSSSSVFKGLAIGSNGTARFLYAADFANKGVVVFDSRFRRANLSTGGNASFVDPTIPSDFSPFGIANILGDIFVAYARQNSSSPGDEVAGAGLGFVSVFNATGSFIRRFATGDVLNAPWGMALAPISFGQFGGRLLVGNFGDGQLWAYDFATGTRLGQLTTTDNSTIAIDGLWGIAFGNGVMNQPTNALFFNAGINNEADGLFGRIAAA